MGAFWGGGWGWGCGWGGGDININRNNNFNSQHEHRWRWQRNQVNPLGNRGGGDGSWGAIAAVLAETNGSTIPRIAAGHHIGTRQQPTGLVGPLEETLWQTVKPAHDNRLAVREAISPATAQVQAPAIAVRPGQWLVSGIGASNRPGSGGLGDRAGGGGADRIGSHDLSRSGGGDRSAFGGGTDRYSGSSSRQGSSRGSSSSRSSGGGGFSGGSRGGGRLQRWKSWRWWRRSRRWWRKTLGKGRHPMDRFRRMK